MGNKLLDQWMPHMGNVLKPPVAPDPVEDEYDPPFGSVWLVVVDYAGRVSVLETPNIHPALLDEGPQAEYLGIPPDSDSAPGIYRWTCSYHESRDWESGQVDNWWFDVEKEELVWSPNSD